MAQVVIFLAVCFLFISCFQPHHAKLPPFFCPDIERPQALCLNPEAVMSDCTLTKTVGGESHNHTPSQSHPLFFLFLIAYHINDTLWTSPPS
jgi:hypothetical protein